MQLMLTGEIITSQEALRIGLVNEVTPPADLMARAEALARKILANAPLAVQHMMEAVMEMPVAQGLVLEADLFGACCRTEDKREGTAAFLEKRTAQFKGK
jgi:enoyl-CoA hydratase